MKNPKAVKRRIPSQCAKSLYPSMLEGVRSNPRKSSNLNAGVEVGSALLSPTVCYAEGGSEDTMPPEKALSLAPRSPHNDDLVQLHLADWRGAIPELPIAVNAHIEGAGCRGFRSSRAQSAAARAPRRSAFHGET